MNAALRPAWVICLASLLLVACHGSLPDEPLPAALAKSELQLEEVVESLQAHPWALWRPDAEKVRQFLAQQYHSIVSELEKTSKEELEKTYAEIDGMELPADLEERREKTGKMGLLVGVLECSNKWALIHHIDRESLRPLFTKIIVDSICGESNGKCLEFHYYVKNMPESWLEIEKDSIDSKSKLEGLVQMIFTLEAALQRPFYTTLAQTGRANEFFIGRFPDYYDRSRFGVHRQCAAPM